MGVLITDIKDQMDLSTVLTFQTNWLFIFVLIDLTQYIVAELKDQMGNITDLKDQSGTITDLKDKIILLLL